MKVEIHRELFWKLKKSQKNSNQLSTRLLTPGMVTIVMPNQPAADKVVLSLRLGRALKRRVEKAAGKHQMTITDYVDWVLQRETRDIELTPEDYERIAQETRKAQKGTDEDKRLRKSRAAGQTNYRSK